MRNIVTATRPEPREIACLPETLPDSPRRNMDTHPLIRGPTHTRNYSNYDPNNAHQHLGEHQHVRDVDGGPSPPRLVLFWSWSRSSQRSSSVFLSILPARVISVLALQRSACSYTCHCFFFRGASRYFVQAGPSGICYSS